METWTRTWKHGRGHGNMDEDMETWRGHDIMNEYMEGIKTKTWKHGRGHGDMVEDMEAWTRD